MARPLIFFGPLKDRIIDELLLHDSQFTTCVLREYFYFVRICI